MVPTIFANQGTTAEHNTAIENAIHQGYSAINAGCAYDPTNAPAIAQAQKAGIVFSLYGVTKQQAGQVKIPYVNVDPYVLDGQLAAAAAPEHHGAVPVLRGHDDLRSCGPAAGAPTGSTASVACSACRPCPARR